MKRLSVCLNTMLLVSAAALAAPPIPPHVATDGYAVDLAGALPKADRDLLNAKLLAYKARTGNQFAVVTVPSVGNADIKEYANLLFHQWGIGDATQDNGILLLWALKERKVRIEVGYGLESKLTDGAAGLILRDDILPLFKQGKFVEGLNNGVDLIMQRLERPLEAAVAPVKAAPVAPVKAVNTAGLDWMWIGGFLALGLAGFAFLVWYLEDDDPIAPVAPKLPAKFAASPAPAQEYPLNATSRPFRSPVITPNRAKSKASTDSRRSTYEAPTYVSIPSSYDSGGSSSWGSSDSGGGSFGGGDSGGGGADGGY